MVTACGNGTVSIFNSDRKYITIQAHKKEVSSVHWKESILTSGWDSTLKIVIIKRFSMYMFLLLPKMTCWHILKFFLSFILVGSSNIFEYNNL